MTARENKSASVNEGIQGPVTAEVVAVGRSAHAVKVIRSEIDKAELRKAVREFQLAVDALGLQPAAKQTVEEDVAKIETAARKPRPDGSRINGLIETIMGKLKMVGVVIADVAALSESLKKIAELLRG